VSRVDAEGRRSYVSPASKRLLGYDPAELLGSSVMETIYAEDRPTLEAAFRKLRTGECKEVTTSFRCTHRDGSVIWIEAALRIAEDPLTGRPDGIVAVSRDITERKRLETQLTELARTDGLTELANRRTFDEALVLEVRRASRQSTALSLILIDVDRFKLYNDTFGHPAGDECLRAVAGALDAVVGRPGDLVARYGGEEFVLLLPATDASSAMVVAEKARAAIEALAIPHGANQPSGIVTISVGVATGISTPAAGGIDQGWLVQAADAALYRAKSEGRNRSVAAARRAFRGAPWQVA
jgi:diguanylate cyclase (GGDEF)-like protein/PAS domain S-box-containing protein